MDNTLWGVSWMVCAIFMLVMYIVRAGGQDIAIHKLKKENNQLMKENAKLVKKLAEFDKREAWRREFESQC